MAPSAGLCQARRPPALHCHPGGAAKPGHHHRSFDLVGCSGNRVGQWSLAKRSGLISSLLQNLRTRNFNPPSVCAQSFSRLIGPICAPDRRDKPKGCRARRLVPNGVARQDARLGAGYPPVFACWRAADLIASHSRRVSSPSWAAS